MQFINIVNLNALVLWVSSTNITVVTYAICQPSLRANDKKIEEILSTVIVTKH